MIGRTTRHQIAGLLLAVLATAMTITGCGSEPQPAPTATADIPATVSAAVAEALPTSIVQPAIPSSATSTGRRVTVRTGYCGRLCEEGDYWRTITLDDVRDELDAGADVNATDRSGWTPLHIAVAYRYTDIVAFLLSQDADPSIRDHNGFDALWVAVIGDPPDPEIVALLLEHGADVNRVNDQDMANLSPLHYAMISDGGIATYETVKILLDYGADVESGSNIDDTPLHFASSGASDDVITLLLDQGANINAYNRHGETPLHRAAQSNNPQNVDVLLRRGANPRGRTISGQTPCEYAIEHHRLCYGNPADFDPVAAINCLGDTTDEAEPTQKEVISLLCVAPDIQATIDAAVAAAIQESTTAPKRAGEKEATPHPRTVHSDSIQQWSEPPSQIIDVSAMYSAVLHTSVGSITVELLTEEAPNTVNNFVFLSREGFYDNVIFHRTIEGFMIQGGDPTGTGGGGPGYTFADEPVHRAYSRGVMAMANAGPNTNGSQFFIMHTDYPLPPSYTIFGQVVAGLDIVDAIVAAPTLLEGEGSTPVNPVVIQSVEIIGP